MAAAGEMSTELFLTTVFDGCSHNINLRAIDAMKKLPTKEDFVPSAAEALRFLEQYGGSYNIYFGVATRNGAGTKEAIREIVTVHADIDFKYTCRDKAVSLLESLPLRPTIIVETGGGLHVYWLLKEPEGKDAIPRVEAINRGLAKALGGDLGAWDASRVLRLPGSWNRKPEYGEPRPVRILEAAPERRFNLSDFADFEEPQSAPVYSRPAAPETSDLLALGLIDAVFEKCALFEGMRRNALTAGRLLPGDKPGEHLARIRVANLYRAFDGGAERAVQDVFSRLEDFDPKETAKQLASLHGAPPPCAEICPAGSCDAIKALGKISPIAFAYEARRLERKVEASVAVSEKKTTAAGKNTAKAETPSLEFPGHVMTGVAGAFAEVYSAVLEPSPPFFYVSFLACLGSLLAGKLTLSSEIQPPSRFYAVLLGESADDRKSTAIKATVDFFRKFMSRFPVSWGVGSAEGLQKELEENPRLLLALDELKQFVSKCKIEGSVLLSCVTSLFENSFYSARTKTTSVKLENVHLSLLAASTIQTFETMFGATFIDIGFLNRLWIVPGSGARRFSIPGKIPGADLETLRLLLGDVLQIAETVREMNIVPEAREMFDRWYLSLPQTVHAKRIDTYALRLMPLLAVNDRKKEVDTETVRKVIDLCDHQVRVRQLYDPVDTDNAVAGVEEKIRRNLRLKGPLSERDLKRGVHASRIGLWMYNQAKTNLIRAREVRYDKGDGVYFLQPGAGS